MALIQCDECGREISDKASACPGCGAPVLAPADLLEPLPPAPALPAAMAPLLQEIEQAYGDWLGADDYFGELDTETAEARLKRSLNAFVAGAVVDAGREPGEVAATLQRRFPEAPVEQMTGIEARAIVSEDGGIEHYAHRRVFCSRCGAEAVEGAVVCVKCGCQLARAGSSGLDDRPSGGYAVLGFFFPVVGLILYLVWKGDYPLRARSCGTGAAWGFGLSVGSYLLYFIVLLSAL